MIIQEKIYCPSCGHPNVVNYKYCMRCGIELPRGIVPENNLLVENKVINTEELKPTIDTNTIPHSKPKDVALAIFLAFLFGPFGLLYATISGGLTMILIPVLLLLLLLIGGITANLLIIFSSLALLFLGTFFYWLICIVWAAIAVGNYNTSLKHRK